MSAHDEGPLTMAEAMDNLRTGIADFVTVVTVTFAEALENARLAVASLVDWYAGIPPRERLDLWLAGEPWHVRALWRPYVWMLDRLGYQWTGREWPR